LKEENLKKLEARKVGARRSWSLKKLEARKARKELLTRQLTPALAPFLPASKFPLVCEKT
jgi:hypothetical protein